MSEDDLTHLSHLDKIQDDSFDGNSLQSNSFIMKFLKDFNEDHYNDLKSSSSLQLSKSSISQVNEPNTVIINKASQEYNFCIKTEENPMKTLSDLSFNESLHLKEVPNAAWRMSEAVTSAKNSFIEEHKDWYAENPPHTRKYSIHQSSFAIPNKIFCSYCECRVYTQVFFQSIKPDFWTSCENFFNSFRCCETKTSRPIQELIHTCRKCHRILARISTE